MGTTVLAVISTIFGFFTSKKDGATQILRVLRFQTGITVTGTGL